jgi:hypothetical protein
MWVVEETAGKKKTMKSALFEAIEVNMVTGKMSYPSPEGFVLNMEKMYRTVALFVPHCATVEMAIKQAIHQQIIAYEGMAPILAMAEKKS